MLQIQRMKQNRVDSRVDLVVIVFYFLAEPIDLHIELHLEFVEALFVEALVETLFVEALVEALLEFVEFLIEALLEFVEALVEALLESVESLLHFLIQLCQLSFDRKKLTS